MTWQHMETAPKDGTYILVCRNNGCAWEYVAVWYFRLDKTYPWISADNAYPEGRLDYWMPIPEPPYEIRNDE